MATQTFQKQVIDKAKECLASFTEANGISPKSFEHKLPAKGLRPKIWKKGMSSRKNI
jgi:hypothetical protein